MLTIDCDTHISDSEGGISITAEELLRRMDRLEIDKAMCWVHSPYIKTRLPEYNAYVAASTKKYPTRLYGLGWVNPMLGVAEAVALTKKCLDEYGFYGIKINGSVDKYYIDDKAITYPLIEEAGKAGKVVAFHCAADDPAHVHPHRMGNVVKDFPEIEFVMIHMGGESYADSSLAAIQVAQLYPNVTLVGSEIGKASVMQAIEVLGADRVAYGSDTPFALTSAEIGAWRTMLKDADLSDADIAKIMGGNVARIMKLPV